MPVSEFLSRVCFAKASDFKSRRLLSDQEQAQRVMSDRSLAYFPVGGAGFKSIHAKSDGRLTSA